MVQISWLWQYIHYLSIPLYINSKSKPFSRDSSRDLTIILFFRWTWFTWRLKLVPCPPGRWILYTSWTWWTSTSWFPVLQEDGSFTPDEPGEPQLVGPLSSRKMDPLHLMSLRNLDKLVPCPPGRWILYIWWTWWTSTSWFPVLQED